MTTTQELPIEGANDPDIGMCDFCGDEDSSRHRVLIVSSINGRRCRCVTWVCALCRTALRSEGRLA